MKSFFIILLVFTNVVGFGQIPFDDYLNEIKNREVKEKFLSFKAKTDAFLLKDYKPSQKKLFHFDFRNSIIVGGEIRPSYYSLFDWKDTSEYSTVIHSYNFADSRINLSENINIYYDSNGKEISYQSKYDCLIKEVLIKIYNKGYLEKILKTAREHRFEHLYTIIQVAKNTQQYSIILKDKVLPHVFVILQSSSTLVCGTSE